MAADHACKVRLREKRAHAVVEKGFDEGKTFIRRYDDKKEYMIRGGKYPTCERAYLGETMPLPTLPETSTFQGYETVEGVRCEHWMDDVVTNRVHIYVEAEGQRLPRRLTDEAVMDGESVPLMTYDWHDLKVQEPSSSIFDLPEPYTHKSCTRQIGGFPYLHAFHWYLRF